MKKERISSIVDKLNTKAALKQNVYALTCSYFKSIKEICSEIADDINNTKAIKDERVKVRLKPIDDMEFHLQIGGDLIVFLLQSNVVAFPNDHLIYKQKYIKKDKDNAYFGQILIYNYMADTIRYNRLNDTGYLIERIFVNREEKFYVEGMSNLNFSYLQVEQNDLSTEILEKLIHEGIELALETDLVITSYEQNFQLSLEKKSMNRSNTSGKKLGFQMSHEID